MNRKITNVTMSALALGLALLQPGRAMAQAAQPNAQAKLAAAIKEIRTETALTRDQLQSTVDALDVLVKQKTGDLRPTYNAFVAEVKKTHAAAEWTASRGAAMQSASAAYFSAWQGEVGGISNDSLRKKAQKRLDAVRKSYDKVVDSLREASTSFKPFLSNLDDVEKTLANDVTPGGVKAVRGTASDANFNVKKVRWRVGDALKELDRMGKALSPEAAG
jgi:septal ring factor EnvC (AmiA/AmiB activator)